MTLPMTDDWITTKQAADLSGYNVQYVRRLIRNGKVDARKFATVWQVNRQSLLTYLAEAEETDDRRHGPR